MHPLELSLLSGLSCTILMLLLRTVFALGKLTKQVDMIERLLIHHLEADK